MKLMYKILTFVATTSAITAVILQKMYMHTKTKVSFFRKMLRMFSFVQHPLSKSMCKKRKLSFTHFRLPFAFFSK
jgi:hypothetical protein